MFFALTDEQRALQETVRAFLRERFGLDRVRAVVEDPRGDGDPPDLWRAVADQGWLAVLVPEEYDGLGLGLLDAVVLARCWGAGVVPGPYLPTLAGAEAVRLAGSAQQRSTWLPGVAAGEVKLTLAATARVQRGDRTVTGTLRYVEYAGVADRIVAVDGDAMFLVDPRDPGAAIAQQPAMDGTTRLSTVTLTDAPAERLSGSSASTVRSVLDRAAVLAAADLTGIAREALTRTVAYDKERVQFGRPVGSFQAIKHALADLHVAVLMAEHGALYAGHALDEALPDAALAVSVAKAKASDTARDVTAAMIQFLGGIGYTWEHDAHFFFKRAKRLEYAYGDATVHRERIARLVVDGQQPPAG